MKKTDALFVGAALLMVLFLNTYFNLTSDVAINEDGQTLADKFYLAGPDPYYNMRLVETTADTGQYPFMGGEHGGLDPLLNYPLGGTGGRPPLFNMMAIGTGKLMSLFMGEVDGLGYAMQFLPALYGALLVIPVYFIGAMLFSRKAGIIGAWLVPLIPVHLGSGHGSAFSLYDHDSFILLLSTVTIMFLMMSIREKHPRKSMLYAALSGVFIASITMTWVSSQYIYAVVAVYAVVQMIVDILTKKIAIDTVRSVLVALFTGYLISFPVLFVRHGFSPTIHLIIPVAVAVFSAIYLWLGKKNLPWLISVPTLFGIGGVSLVFLYFIRDTTNALLQPFAQIGNLIFGSGIYGSKVSLTIAEAASFDFSRTAMSFGPVVYLLGWFGFLLVLYRYYKKGLRKDYLFMITWFLIEAWLLSVAGRFLNDLVPLMAILSGFVLWFILSKIDFASMAKTIRSVGGGWYGLKKAVKLRHVAGALTIACFLVLPNGWLAFDASVPSAMKRDFDKDMNALGAFGLGLSTEKYWQDALQWLRNQNSGIEDAKKPAFISWWDYGFYCVAVAKNPTVADNFQEGIPAAANFHTSQNEDEAITVLITRLVEGNMAHNDGKVGKKVKGVFYSHLDNESAGALITIFEDPKSYANTSYNTIIGEEYGGEKYRVQEQNARYHDATQLMLSKLSGEGIVQLYRDLQNVTETSIRYYGVEGYDVNIFNVFTFLADKGTYGYETPEDDYFKLYYVSEKTGQKFTPDELENITEGMTQEDIRDTYGKFNPSVYRKTAFYTSMVYRTYMGTTPQNLFENLSRSGLIPFWTDNQQNPLGDGNYFYYPTAYLKHFYLDYLSPLNTTKSLPFGRASLCVGMPAVVIAKYYEGARIEGVVKSEGEPMENVTVIVRDDFKQTLELPYGGQVLTRTLEKIPHDYDVTDADGTFSVIAPAGNITLSLYSGGVLIKDVTFNGTGVFAPITEEEATRTGPWQRNVGTISIDKGGVKGIVYWDKDGDGTYNASIDTPLKARVSVGGEETQTDSSGRYEIQGLMPERYTVTAIKEGYDAQRADVNIVPDDTVWHNVSMTLSKVDVSGKIWYDENSNGKLDENETVSGVTVKFTVIDAIDDNAGNRSATSDTGGNYTVNLYPSKYRITVDYTTTVEGTSIHYTYEDTIDIKIGDSPKTKNIKLSRD